MHNAGVLGQEFEPTLAAAQSGDDVAFGVSGVPRTLSCSAT